MSIKKILKKYIFLSNEQFGQISKMAYRFEDGEEIDKNDTTIENQMFFKIYIQPDVEHMLNERKRSKENRERRKQN